MKSVVVTNLNSLHALQNHEVGEVAYVEDIEKFYIYTPNGWVQWQPDVAPTESDIQLSLYEVNKQIIAQLPTLSGVQLDEAKLTLSHYVNGLDHNDDYYMLLCYDLRYFTMFARDQKYEENIVDAIMDCLSYVGEVKSVEESEDGQAIEIWIVSEGEAYVMYFFDYGRGVVLCQ